MEASAGSLAAKRRFNWYPFAVVLIFAVGCFVRIYGIGTLFGGINQDEASIGYEAFAIAGWGIDRHGVSLPAYLIAWGSGQNAGYAYLLIPFIKLFGLSLTTLRLPMALVGCVSMGAIYSILRRHPDRKLALLGLFLFAICPWHILKSRWALESNLFPDLLLWGVALLCTGIAGGKKRWFYLAFAVFGLSAWAYATSFLVLPLFLLPVAFVLWRRRYLTLPHIIGCFAALVATSWPIILFALITMLGLPTIETPLFTIPAMLYSRTNEFSFLAENPIAETLANLRRTVQVLSAQDDSLLLNAVPGYGLFYLISPPFILLGFLRSVLPRVKGGKYRGVLPGSWIFLPWLAATGTLGVLIYGNINRLNGLWIPLIWYWILGVYELICVDKVWRVALPAIYTVLFAFYCNTLFGSHMEQINLSNEKGMLEAMRYADTLDTDVYVRSVHETYIRILFATEMPPDEYLASEVVVVEEPAGPVVTRVGKWYCTELPEPPPEGDFAVILSSEVEEVYREMGWEVESFGNFFVAQPGEEAGPPARETETETAVAPG